MTDIAATVAVPASQIDTARTIGSDQWGFIRALTDTQGGQTITHYVSSGAADAGLLALILALPGALVDYTSPWQDALAGFGLYLWVDPNGGI